MYQAAYVPSGMTYKLPAIEMHAGEFSIVWFSDMDVERLALVNVSATICCHLQDSLLRDFPHCFVQLLQIIRDLCNVLWAVKWVSRTTVTSKIAFILLHFYTKVACYLYGTILSNQLVLHLITPQGSFCEVLQEVRVHNLWERKYSFYLVFLTP